MKSSILNRNSIIMIAASFIFLLYMFFVLVILKEIEFVYLFTYVFSMDWFIYPIIALYLNTIGIILLNYNIVYRNIKLSHPSSFKIEPPRNLF
jgi:hypothetical protein